MGGKLWGHVDTEEVLRTERLLLEPLLRGHAAPLFALLRDERIYRYIPQDPPVSSAVLEERYGWLESRSSPDGDEAWLNWAARLAASSEYVGRVEASVESGGRAWIAYELGPAFWNRGYAAEACTRVLRLLFDGYGVAEVVAEVDTRNRASISLLERLGFDRISFQAAADFFKGAQSDEYTYRLVPPDGT